MRKILSLLMLSLMAVVGLSAKTLYLAPNDNWKSANARFAVYAFNDTENAWAGMTAVEGEDGLYQATVDDKYPTVIFCRMNGTTTENNWDNKWNQTGDETVPADKNLFTVTGDAWDNPASNWSTYTPATSGGEETSDAITLTFTYYDKADGDGSTKLSTVEAIFDAASQAYVSAVNVGTQVYAGRYYLVGEDTIKSNLKLGSSKAAGELKFTLADSVEVDSIVFRAAMYSASEGGDGFNVNGENFTLSAGKLNFEDKVWKPTGFVSTIDIVQNKASGGRFFLTAIIIYPKVAGEDPVTPPTPAAKDSIYFVNVAGWETPVVHLWGGTAEGTSWPGVAMIKLADQINNYDVYKYVADAGAYAHCIFSNNGNNQTADLDWTSGKYFYNGAWYELDSIPAPVIPAKYYITGDSALVGAELEWHPDAVKAENDTLVLNLAAGDYTLKVTVDGTWSTAKGYSDLTVKADGLSTDKDNNIHFTLAEAGAVKVIYTNELFKLEGNFYVAPVAKFWVAGGEDIVGEGHATWAKEGALVSYKDTLTLYLAAGAHEFKLITENDEWWGIEHLTDTAAGIYTNSYTNVCFKLAEAGNVNVIYKAGEVFKVEGNFYVAPQAKYYVIGDSALVVNAGLTEDKAWTPDAIVATNDTLVLNLAAGDYTMRLSLYGGWDNNKGYEALTDTTAGLREYVDEYQNHNIIFTLAEAGAVTIIYNANEFKILGSFYVAPAPDPTVAVIGSMTEWAQAIPFELAEDKLSATFSDTIPAGEYEFKMLINGEYRSNGWWFNRNVLGAANITGNDDANMLLQADVTGYYTFTWYFANDSLGMVFPEAPVVVPAKFYVTGDSALVVDAGLEAEKAWAPNAIKSEADTLVLSLKAKQEYKLKVTVDGTWDSAKSFENLTDTAAGLAADNDGNICFTLAEAGEVQVIYTSEMFKLVGNFYVAPAPDPTVAVIGSMTEWAQAIPFELAEDKLSATFSDTIPAGEYEFKMLINGEYRSNGWWFNRNVLGAANITGNDDANMLLQADVTGYYTFTWYFANDSLGMVFPEAPVVVPAKFYVTGDSALVVDAGLDAEKAWAPNAIKSEADTLVLSLKAEQAYKLKVTVDGTWDSAKSFENLTDTAAGLAADNDGNICFTLAEAGEVQVIYTAEMFKLVGNFYVAPAPDPTAAVAGSFNEWAEPFAFELAEDKQSASFSANIAVGSYEFKMIINGEYRSNGYRYHRGFPACAGISGNEVANMIFEADVQGDYTFTWFFANDSLDIIYPEKPEPVLTDGYYLVGKFGGVDAWSVIDLSAEKLFAANPETEGEYSLLFTLAEGDEIKVVSVEDDAIVTWYPAEGTNYVVDANHAGATTVYFRPDYQGGDDWYEACLYVAPTGTVDIDTTQVDVKAVKVLRDGQIYIIKGDKMYNVIGTLVR